MFDDHVIAGLEQRCSNDKIGFASPGRHQNVVGRKAIVLRCDNLPQQRQTEMITIPKRQRAQVDVQFVEGEKLDSTFTNIVFDFILMGVKLIFEDHPFEPHRALQFLLGDVDRGNSIPSPPR